MLAGDLAAEGDELLAGLFVDDGLHEGWVGIAKLLLQVVEGE
jgi:hypothetical protein